MKQMLIKKLVYLFVTVVAMTAFPVLSMAQDNGDDEYEAIDLNYEQNNNNIGVRTGVVIPVEAYYMNGMSAVYVEFMMNVGEIEIRLTHLTTGSTTSTLVHSSIGSCILPVTGGPGMYRITFITESGEQYYGMFNSQQ